MSHDAESTNRPPKEPETPVEPSPAPPIPQTTPESSSSGYSADIAREVEEAVAGMSIDELMDIAPGAAPAPTATGGKSASGAHESDGDGILKLGRIVGIHGDDVFLDLGGKTQAVVSKAQFESDEKLTVGGMLQVTLDQYDASNGLWIASREGAIRAANWETLKVGAIVEGRVSGLNKGGLEIDMKGIMGFMPASHVDIDRLKDISVFLNEKVTCEVMEVHKRQRRILLSRRKWLERQQLEERERILAELEPGQVRKGIVRSITSFGAFVNLGGGVDGLVHVRELRWSGTEKVSDVVSEGQTVEVKVLKVDLERGRISLSMKHATPDPWNGVEDRYPEGTSLKARVVRLANFGAFAELESGVDGLIPVSEMSWTHGVRPDKMVEVGGMVDVVVIRMDAAERRIALSMKRVQPDPWDGVFEGFAKGSVVTGKITRLADFGAFVELAPGVEGLVHISELSPQRVNRCEDVVQPGQEVKVRVLKVDAGKRRIGLSIKGVDEPTGAEAMAAMAEHAANAKPKKKRAKPLRGGLSSSWDWMGTSLDS
ncbi:MAG: S1 RNA-binding domain-containing protein [Planctomycetes bacterium]|nr:S1 RNA-binding domain-containing protein [Planctomycetota bacterium]